MNATDRRRELMDLAEEINKLRVSLAQEIHKLNEGVSLLVNEAEKVLIDAVDEHEKGIKPSRVIDPMTGLSDSMLQHIAAEGRKRACSICGVPGHRKTTCPKANEAYAQRGEPRMKKPRKPLTPEQRAAKAKILEKARAARRKKS